MENIQMKQFSLDDSKASHWQNIMFANKTIKENMTRETVSKILT